MPFHEVSLQTRYIKGKPVTKYFEKRGEVKAPPPRMTAQSGVGKLDAVHRDLHALHDKILKTPKDERGELHKKCAELEQQIEAIHALHQARTVPPRELIYSHTFHEPGPLGIRLVTCPNRYNAGVEVGFLAPDADPGIANCVGFRLAAIETATAYLSLEGLHLNEVMEAMAGRGRPLTLHFSAAPSQETPFTFPPGL